MRFPWGFNPPKESFETRTLIGRMWKRSNALSWPILIAREAWSYNLKTWTWCDENRINTRLTGVFIVTLMLEHVINTPTLLLLFVKNCFKWLSDKWFEDSLRRWCYENSIERTAFLLVIGNWWKPTAHKSYQLCLAAIANWTHPFPSRTGPWNDSAPMIVCSLHAKVGHCQAFY